MNVLMRLSMFLAEGAADGADVPAEPDMMSYLFTFISMGLVVVVFYFFLIRPDSKRKKAMAKMRDELIVGDEVTTIGGIVGKVVSIKDDTITVETGAEKTRLKFMRWAVSSKGTKETAE